MDRELVQRISQYRKVLYKLKSLGFAKVFSDNLGDAKAIMDEFSLNEAEAEKMKRSKADEDKEMKKQIR